MTTIAVKVWCDHADHFDNPIGAALVDLTPAYAARVRRRRQALEMIMVDEEPSPYLSVQSIHYWDYTPQWINLYEGWEEDEWGDEGHAGIFFYAADGQPCPLRDELDEWGEEVVHLQAVADEAIPEEACHRMDYCRLVVRQDGVYGEGRSKYAYGTVSTATVPWDTIRDIAAMNHA
jgi:hypothetical protein